ncbi:Lrp/AsnC family transcriptional regulator [Sodalis sp. C49]|uniref:Lrp/AsnC family transcriptional regulator n=1 Tax=Sodalis sp. C49 TaxID=3228929 RepID=UPI003965A85B
MPNQRQYFRGWKHVSKSKQTARSAFSRLDAADRKLLALLSEDATRSYAELGQLMHLSPPAIHERAKRLRQDGVIKGTVALLDGKKLGRPLLAFVHVDTKNWTSTRRILEFRAFNEVEEIHTVTGESAILLKVRTQDTQSLEALLGKIHEIEGVSSTHSHIALSTYLERGPSPLMDGDDAD